MSHGLSVWLLLLDLTRLAVLVLLVAKSGRYERLLALAFVLTWLAEQLAARLDGGWGLGVGGAGEFGFLAAHLWVLGRHRPGWLVAATLLQACKTALVAAGGTEAAGGTSAAAALAYAHLACLALLVARRHLGPPARPPRAEELGQA